jgi:predicted metal-binding membrane protein
MIKNELSKLTRADVLGINTGAIYMGAFQGVFISVKCHWAIIFCVLMGIGGYIAWGLLATIFTLAAKELRS